MRQLLVGILILHIVVCSIEISHAADYPITVIRDDKCNDTVTLPCPTAEVIGAGRLELLFAGRTRPVRCNIDIVIPSSCGLSQSYAIYFNARAIVMHNTSSLTFSDKNDVSIPSITWQTGRWYPWMMRYVHMYYYNQFVSFGQFFTSYNATPSVTVRYVKGQRSKADGVSIDYTVYQQSSGGTNKCWALNGYADNNALCETSDYLARLTCPTGYDPVSGSPADAKDRSGCDTNQAANQPAPTTGYPPPQNADMGTYCGRELVLPCPATHVYTFGTITLPWTLQPGCIMNVTVEPTCTLAANISIYFNIPMLYLGTTDSIEIYQTVPDQSSSTLKKRIVTGTGGQVLLDFSTRPYASFQYKRANPLISSWSQANIDYAVVESTSNANNIYCPSLNGYVQINPVDYCNNWKIYCPIFYNDVTPTSNNPATGSDKTGCPSATLSPYGANGEEFTFPNATEYVNLQCGTEYIVPCPSMFTTDYATGVKSFTVAYNQQMYGSFIPRQANCIVNFTVPNNCSTYVNSEMAIFASVKPTWAQKSPFQETTAYYRPSRFGILQAIVDIYERKLTLEERLLKHLQLSNRNPNAQAFFKTGYSDKPYVSLQYKPEIITTRYNNLLEFNVMILYRNPVDLHQTFCPALNGYFNNDLCLNYEENQYRMYCPTAFNPNNTGYDTSSLSTELVDYAVCDNIRLPGTATIPNMVQTSTAVSPTTTTAPASCSLCRHNCILTCDNNGICSTRYFTIFAACKKGITTIPDANNTAATEFVYKTDQSFKCRQNGYNLHTRLLGRRQKREVIPESLKVTCQTGRLEFSETDALLSEATVLSFSVDSSNECRNIFNSLLDYALTV